MIFTDSELSQIDTTTKVSDFGPCDIYKCERLAERFGYGRLRFVALFPAGPKVCTWLDAHMGIIQIEGMDGFVMTRDLDEAFPGLVCIPMSVEEAP